MAQQARTVFGPHRGVGMSKKRREELARLTPPPKNYIPHPLYHAMKEHGMTPPAPPGRESFGAALDAAAHSRKVTTALENRIIHSKVKAPYLEHHVRIPSRDTWSVLDADTQELLGTYSTGKAANGASAYFARFGHNTLVRRILPV